MILLLSLMTGALLGQISASISTASMVAEIVEDHETRHGTRIEGVFFAGYLMVQKLGHALGIFLVGQLVAFAGLRDRMRPEELAPGTAASMAWVFALMMVVLAIARASSCAATGSTARDTRPGWHCCTRRYAAKRATTPAPDRSCHHAAG